MNHSNQQKSNYFPHKIQKDKNKWNHLDDEDEKTDDDHHEEDDINKNKNIFFCMNCGKKGHLTKKCNYPIISLGVIAIHFEKEELNLNSILSFSKKIQNKYLFQQDEIHELRNCYEKLKDITELNFDEHIRYLMIRRRNTLSYVDFLRGKYDLDDFEYIYNTILMMTQEEKNKLLHHTFEELWCDLWGSSIEQVQHNHNQEYEESRIKFQKLKDGFMIQKNEILFPMNLRKIIESGIESYENPEWGFPKGRRNIHEKNIECAKREFQEETNINEIDYHILNVSPLEEIYLGSNHIRYKHIYYFAQIQRRIELGVDFKNSNQKVEIGDIQWVTFQEGYWMIRNYHKEKRNILFNTHQFMKNLILHFLELYQQFYQKNKHNYHL